MKKIAIAASLGMAVLASPVFAQSTTQTPSTAYYDISQFDIVGVKIGMRPDEVMKALRDSGFEVKTSLSLTAFERDVYQRALSLKQPMPNISVAKGPKSIYGSDKQGNGLSVSFIGLASGPEVVHITLTFNGITNKTDQLDKDIAAKYGPPSTVKPISWTNVWCAEGDRACKNPFGENSRVFYHHWYVNHKINLSNYGPAKALLEQQISSYFSAPTNNRQRSLLSSN